MRNIVQGTPAPSRKLEESGNSVGAGQMRRRIGTIAAALLILASPMPMAGECQEERTYIFPVQPQGKASFGKGGHNYPATDIFAPVGSLFVAPVSGKIEDLQREDRWDSKKADPAFKGGRWVSLLGDDGYRYYGSHLVRVSPDISVGQRVAGGTRLGEVGNSGNARSTPAHLHFGVSKDSRPYSWQVRRGEIDPVLLLRCMLRKGCDPGKEGPLHSPTKE
jgi:murein DD-endopeptidase MepM/ murein hydrolase activator NlpD